MKRYNKNLGDFGEETAKSYLTRKGYEIIERNFCVKGGEIDIICIDSGTLVFVEVKTRSSEKFGLPSEAIDKRKSGHLRCAAERYFEGHDYDCDVRFDVVEVYAELNGDEFSIKGINHITDIVLD